MDHHTFYESENSKVLRRSYKQFEVPCHRAGHDIVIPQLIPPRHGYLSIYHDYINTHVPLREFDSTFSGIMSGDQLHLRLMNQTSKVDYANNHTEKFVLSAAVSGDHSLKYRGYFMYSPCGVACWAQRVYEALAVYTIPILINDGGIQAFERFIDWKKFSVKISSRTFLNSTALTIFRTQVRDEADEFRSRLLKCWKSLNISTKIVRVDPYRYRPDMRLASGYYKVLRADSRQSDTRWLVEAKNGNKVCAKAFNTTYWRKTQAMERVVPWFDFNNSTKTKINAFRLLTLEMWCHINIYTNRKKTIPTICGRQVDHTARLEYF